MDEMSVYQALEEQDANGDRGKFIAWVATFAIIGVCVGFAAGYAASEPENPPALVCALSGTTMFPVCKTEGAS